MAEQFETPVGLSAAGGTWNFSIDGDGNLELRSNSPAGEGDIRMRFNDDTGQVLVGSTANPTTLECHSEFLLRDSADILRLHLQAEDPSIHMFNSSGQAIASLSDTANLRLGGHGMAGNILVFPTTATDPEDNTQAAVQIMGNSGDLFLGTNGRDGDLYIRDSSLRNTIHANGNSAWLRVGVEGNNGNLEVQDSSGRRVMHMQGTNAALYVGVSGNEGDIIVRDGEGRHVMHMNGSAAVLTLGAEGNEGDFIVRDGEGRQVMHMNGSNAGLYLGASGNEGDVIIRDASGREVIQLDGGNAIITAGADGNEGDLVVKDGAGRQVMHMDGGNAALYVGASGNEGDIIVRDSAGRDVIHADAGSAWLRVGASGNEGDLEVQDSVGRRVMHMNGEYAALYIGAAGNEGDIIVRDNDGNDSIHLNGGSGDIILRNADAAEKFDLAPAVDAEPGTVMVLDDEGLLRVADRAHDQRVVGVVAGAGAYKPGLVMNGIKSQFAQATISMLGRVACKADAGFGEIKVGDLLTTSPRAGHAMKAQDRSQAAGAIIGKAMSPLKTGCGLVTLMIALQ